MKRIVGVLVSLMIILALSACGDRVVQENPEEISTVEEVQSEKEESITMQRSEEQSSELQETAQETEAEKPKDDGVSKESIESWIRGIGIE